jgi:hypothetical protein
MVTPAGPLASGGMSATLMGAGGYGSLAEAGVLRSVPCAVWLHVSRLLVCGPAA